MDRCVLCGDDFEDGGVWCVSQGKLLELLERPMVGPPFLATASTGTAVDLVFALQHQCSY